MKKIIIGRILAVAAVFALWGCGKPATTPDAMSPSGNSVAGNSASPDGTTSAGQNSGQFSPAPPSLPGSGATAASPVVVRSGTVLSVTFDQSVSSKTSNPGDHFEASLAAPVMVHGTRVIPRGAKVVGRVTDAKSAGKFKGNAAITVTLDSIRVNDKKYSIRTTSVTQAGKGRGKRTGVGAGGGAVVGGIIGAIAGGGKGAAIGAGAGAGAGAAGAGFTGDRDIQIDAETRLSFTLKTRLEIGGN
jgi:hypothetical protein